MTRHFRSPRPGIIVLPALAPPILAALGCTLSSVALLPGHADAQAAASPPFPPAAQQIAAAVLPLPEELRTGAGVLGYDPDGRLVELRAGSNEMVCLADDPADGRFHVACYHRDLEPFMRRGRELREAGAAADEVTRTRLREIESGDLPMPLRPTALYSFTGPEDAFDPEGGTAPGAAPLYVLYVPGATEASTGLSPRPRAGEPWLMDPGTPWAHVMYIPVQDPPPKGAALDERNHGLARAHGGA